jgi:hypothetical protein
MDIRLEVPVAASEGMRSGIYAFISRFAERTDGGDPYVSITIIPTGADFVYHLRFSNPEAGAAFVDYLPTVFQGDVAASVSTSR